MIVVVILIGTFGIHLLLKMNFWATIMVGGYFLLVSPIHMRLLKEQKDQQKRFLDVCEYLEMLLYSFAREGKIIRAFEDVYRSLAEGEMKESVKQAIERMEMITDETEIYSEAMNVVGEKYFCRRVRNVHDFLLHVEYYGGEIEQSIELLIEDKNRWQSRIQEAYKERIGMLREIIMSIGASLMICGVILYLPVVSVDVSKNILSQLAAIVVIILNGLVLLRGQKYLTIDWLTCDDIDEQGNCEEQIMNYRKYDERKGFLQSLVISIPPIAGVGWSLWAGREWWALGFLVVSMICLWQHRIGHKIAYRRLEKCVRSAFPQWIMDIMLLLQSENVHMALRKAYEHAPNILRIDLERLLERLEMEPESVEPYHLFLYDFSIPEVHTAMSTLFSLSEGNSVHMKQQFGELVKRSLQMMHLADSEGLKEKGSGMYLLFLAPVLIASIKLLVDMAIFLLTFLTRNMM